MAVCTLSWWRDGTSYGLFFNRDESRLRPEAEIPSCFEMAGVSYLSPVDPEGGGTWIWVNRNGVIGCLLNNYLVCNDGPAEPVSRGLLLKSLVTQKDSESLCQSVSMVELRNYKGFSIFAMDPNHHRLATWDGANLCLLPEEEVRNPLSSSGYLPDQIIAHRKKLYDSRFDSFPFQDPKALFSYHTFHDPALPAHSVLMSRPDARTVSISQVSVAARTIRFSYGTVSEQCRLRVLTNCSLSRDN